MSQALTLDHPWRPVQPDQGYTGQAWSLLPAGPATTLLDLGSWVVGDPARRLEFLQPGGVGWAAPDREPVSLAMGEDSAPAAFASELGESAAAVVVVEIEEAAAPASEQDEAVVAVAEIDSEIAVVAPVVATREVEIDEAAAVTAKEASPPASPKSSEIADMQVEIASSWKGVEIPV